MKLKYLIFICLWSSLIFQCKKTNLPSITTNNITNVTENSAKAGGNISNDGGAQINSKGVCWATNELPTVADNKTINGVGSGSFESNITNLSSATKYYVRAYATNSAGTSYGETLSFTTLGQLATCATIPVSNILSSSATLNGQINPNYLSTIVSFEYGLTTTYGQSISLPNNPFSGNINQDVSISLSNLDISTTYHFRIKAVNSLGTTYGNDLTFTTLSEKPSTITQQANSITGYTATIYGLINPNGLSSSVNFEYGLTNGYGNSITAVQSPINDNTNQSASANLTSLIPNSTYHFRITATNSLGSSNGSDLTFTTLGQIASVNNNIEINLGANSVTLQGTVNPNYLNTSVVFEYGITTSYGSSVNTTQSPIVGNNPQIVTINLEGLVNNTTYHYRIKATNELGTTYSPDATFKTFYSKISDIDGNSYNTVQIFSQIWMAENLKTTHYQDGSEIINITQDNSWLSTTTGAYCWYFNDQNSYKVTYGALYNWYAVSDPRKICPSGWHIPTDSEWNTLEVSLGGSNYAGSKLKETGNSHWKSPYNKDATNESRFTGLPGGCRNYTATFGRLEYYGYWWSSTSTSNDAISRGLIYNDSKVYRHYDISMSNKTDGLSVRCIKD